MAAGVTVNVHADAEMAVDYVVFPETAYAPFASINLRGSGEQRVAVMTNDPDVLAALGETITAAHTELVAALAHRAAKDAV